MVYDIATAAVAPLPCQPGSLGKVRLKSCNARARRMHRIWVAAWTMVMWEPQVLQGQDQVIRADDGICCMRSWGLPST